MSIATLIRQLQQALAERRRQRVTLNSLDHLTPRLLRDIGLHREGDFVKPLDPDAVVLKNEPIAAKPLTDNSPVTAHCGGAEYCPHCGEVLT